MGEWTKKFRELGKKGGSSKDFKKLYFKMKGSKSGSPVRDISKVILVVRKFQIHLMRNTIKDWYRWIH